MTPQQALQTRPPPESEILYGSKAEGGQPYLLEKRVIVSGEELVDAQPGFDQRTGEPIVTFRFNSSGARKFAQVTQENIGRPFAIVLDNEVISAPYIRDADLRRARGRSRVASRSSRRTTSPSCCGPVRCRPS